MVTQDNIDDLNRLFVTSCELHGWSRKQRYFHLTSVENFIYYLPKIKDQSKKEFAYQHIHEYLTFINKIDSTDELGRSRSYALFKQYLDPLCDIYKSNFNFTYYIQDFYFFPALLLVEIIAILFNAPSWIHVLVLSLFATTFIYKIHMKKQKKIYGLYV